MRNDALSLNGDLLRQPDQLSDIDMLLESNYIYARIHTLDYKALFLDETIKICEWSYKMMYGTDFGLDKVALHDEIETLLIENNYPLGSTVVMLYLFPAKEEATTKIKHCKFHLLSCREQLLYRGYTTWHSGIICDVLPYDIPFACHQTSASLTAHKYAEEYVRRNDANMVLRESYDNIIVSASEYPLFCVVGREVRTTPLTHGASDSIERVIVINIAIYMGFNVVEYPLTKKDISLYDEMFYLTPQGVFSIIECGDSIFPNIIGRKIGYELKRRSQNPYLLLSSSLFT